MSLCVSLPPPLIPLPLTQPLPLAWFVLWKLILVQIPFFRELAGTYYHPPLAAHAHSATATDEDVQRHQARRKKKALRSSSLSQSHSSMDPPLPGDPSHKLTSESVLLQRQRFKDAAARSSGSPRRPNQW